MNELIPDRLHFDATWDIRETANWEKSMKKTVEIETVTRREFIGTTARAAAAMPSSSFTAMGGLEPL